MTTSVDISPSENDVQMSRIKSDKLNSSSSLITRIVSQQLFDSFCIILAEVIGTSALLFFGCAGAIHWNGDPGLATPLNFGLTVMTIIQTFGHISFALLNPAINIVAVVYDLISIKVKKKQFNQRKNKVLTLNN